MHLDFAKELYEAEWARRDQLQAAVSTPMGVLSLLGGGLAYCVVTFQHRWWIATSVLLFSMVLAIAAFVAACYFLVRSYVGYTYRRLPFPSELATYHRELTQFHHDSHTSDATATADSEFGSFLTERLVEATDRNSENNARRGEYLHKANLASVVCMVLLALAVVPLATEMRLRHDEPQKIEIVPPTESSMSDEPKPAPVPQSPSPSTTPAPTSAPGPVRPTAPSNKDLRTEIKVPKKR